MNTYKTKLMSVGTDHKGNVWTEDNLKDIVKSSKDKPVNINYDVSYVVGKVIDCMYDESSKSITATIEVDDTQLSTDMKYSGYGICVESVTCSECKCNASKHEECCDHMKNDMTKQINGPCELSEIAILKEDQAVHKDSILTEVTK